MKLQFLITFSAFGFSSRPHHQKQILRFLHIHILEQSYKKSRNASVFGAVFKICKAGLNVFDVEWQAPDTNPSA